MKRIGAWIALMVIVCAGVAVHAEEPTTLEGEYVWNRMDDGGGLKAVFTPSGEGKFDVEFQFTFRGRPHTYSGSAEGTLSDGELRGEVQNEEKKRTFVFSGEFENGRFKGKHAEIVEGERHKTGTLTLG